MIRRNKKTCKGEKGLLDDPIREASRESFPASDAPARTAHPGVGPPASERGARDGVDMVERNEATGPQGFPAA